MATLGQVMVEVGADLRDFEKAMAGVENQMKNTGRKIQRTGSDFTNNFNRNMQSISRNIDNLPDHLKPFATSIQGTRTELRNLANTGTQSLEQLQDAVLKTRVGYDKMTSVNDSGKKAIKVLQSMKEETDRTRMAVLGLNREGTIKLSAEEQTAQLKKFQDAVTDTRKELEKLRDAGDLGSYDAGMRDLEHQTRLVEQSMIATSRGGRNYINQLRQMGIITSSVGNMTAVQMERMKESIIRSNDMLQAKSTQSKNMIENLGRMKIRGLDQQFLKIGNHLEKMAKRGSVVNVALNELGKNASMHDLQKQMRLINQGLMRMQMLAMASGVAFVGLTAILVKASMESTRLGDSVKEAKSTWAKALQPFIKSWGDVASRVVDCFTAVGNFVNKLNEMNPAISTTIGWIAYLTSGLMVLLSPLAIGISRAGSFAVAFNNLWMATGQLVTGFLAVIGTALLVATIIVAVVYSVKQLWKNSEQLRDVVMGVWTSIKEAVSNAVKPILESWNNLKSSFNDLVAKVTGGAGNMGSVWKFFGDGLSVVIKNIASVVLPILSTAFQIVGLIISGAIDLLVTAINWLSSQWGEHGGKIVAVATVIWGYILQAFGGIRSFLAVILPQVVGIVTDAFGLIKSIISFSVKYIVPIVMQGFKLIAGIIKFLMPVIKSVIVTTWFHITNIIKSAVAIIRNIIQLFTNVLKGNWKGAWENVKNILKNALTLAWNFVQLYLIGRILGIFRGFGGSVGKALSGLAGKITSPFKSAYSSVTGWVSKIKSAISGMFRGKISVPRFSFSGSMNPVQWAKGNTPKINVSWNAKGNIFNGASVLGGGQGVGEAGAEVVMPIQRKRYMKPYASMVASLLDDFEGEKPTGNVRNVFEIAQMVVREDADIKRIAEELERIQRKQNRAKGGHAYA